MAAAFLRSPMLSARGKSSRGFDANREVLDGKFDDLQQL